MTIVPSMEYRYLINMYDFFFKYFYHRNQLVFNFLEKFEGIADGGCRDQTFDDSLPKI